MPTYDYECSKCKHVFEERRSFSDDGKAARCPKCKGKAKRIFTSVPVIFKGSGFYVTDHRKPGAKEESTPAVAGSKSESKSETKKVEKVEAAKPRAK